MPLHLSYCVSEETRDPAVPVEWRRAGFGGPERLPARDGRRLRREALRHGVLAQAAGRAAQPASGARGEEREA